MAINSAEKRRTVAVLGVPIFGAGVTPTLSKDSEWRAQSAWGYAPIGDLREIAIESEYYMITVAEISEATDLTGIMIWDQDGWNTNKVWG